jgi:hypothetical protein
MRQAFFSNGAKYGDFTYFSKPADWKFRVTTPNASSLYVYFNFNTKDGPLVLEFPAAIGAGLFGSILDAWQIPLADFGPEGEDKGKGAKYLILPPNFKSESPVGYLSVRAETYNGYAVLRAIPASSSEQFWAVTVYDLETAAFIHESPKVEINSYQDLQKNTDGSVDIYFGPQAPAGKEPNWIYTARGKTWVTAFRFYGPEQAIHDKTWKMPDIEEVN